MPFVSEAQRRFLFARKPSVAKEFAEKTPRGKKLPERKGSKVFKAISKHRSKA